MLRILEVSGQEFAEEIVRLNGMSPLFPELQPRHLIDGFWWLAFSNAEAVGFAGLVPFTPFPGVGYLKRCYVLPKHRGHGLQRRFMELREQKAKALRWHLLATETPPDAPSSAANFAASGYEEAAPEQPWGAAGSLYWTKKLTA